MNSADFLDYWRDIGNYAAVMRLKYKKIKNFRTIIQDDAEVGFVKIQKGSLDEFSIDEDSVWFLENVGLPGELKMLAADFTALQKPLLLINQSRKISGHHPEKTKYLVIGSRFDNSNDIGVSIYDGSVWEICYGIFDFHGDYSAPNGYVITSRRCIELNIVAMVNKILRFRNLCIEVNLNPKIIEKGRYLRDILLT